MAQGEETRRTPSPKGQQCCPVGAKLDVSFPHPPPRFFSALRDLGETPAMLVPAETQDSLAPR